MLSIPAISRKEHQRSDFLEGTLKGLGFQVTRIHNNLLVGDPDLEDAGPRVLLNSHMDTVSPAEGWVSDPFEPLVDGDRIVGLGSNDAGASVVTMMATYQNMYTEMKGQMNLMLLISAEEEISGSNGISSVLDRMGNLDAVIVGEPTGMQPAVAERGLMVLDGEVKGKAGHAALNEGENAIYRAMKDIESIAGLDFRNQSAWLPQPGAQVTMISAGTGHNVVPDVCRYVVDVRSNDRYGNEAMLERIRSVCMADLKPRSTRLKPSSLNEDHFLMEAIIACKFHPFGSSTLSDMALIPFPAIKIGPGDSARSHTAGEYILMSELEDAVGIYCRLLEALKTNMKQN
ncbi:MAG: M20/M25/M40 family metallo-hydrolase [Bacteroidales bacterium]|nr:M20/M25/M40 family metallo-hydrolase [Bacteroidales bacterium]